VGSVTVAAIVPALDEQASIADVVRRLRAAVPGVRVIVVDNGSTDATAAVARAAGAIVVPCPRRGYGYAARAGTDAAVGASVYVYLDADGSMPPEEVPRLAAPVLRGDADIVLGRRRLARGLMPWHQRAGNRVIAFVLRVRGITVAELGPFRAVRASTLDSLRLPGSRFAWHAEMLARAAAAGARIAEVAVHDAPRLAGRSKVGGSLRGSALATWDIGRVLIRRSVA
jgi:glycosyltransferase involved in cell wall biosynthesis